jgi:23S rRNA-/tRNA-specific pseudouridylate synthase
MIPREVFRDRWILVVDKPAGLPSQAPKGGGDNVHDLLRASEPYVALHHRLDAAASGLLLVGLDRSVNAALAEAFRAHAIARTYLAVGCGDARDGVWDRPVEGQAASTRVEVVGRGGGRSALRLRPETGRKHQLRVHAALAGVPLLGDRAYGGDPAERLALHAAELALVHPATGETVTLSSPLPPELLGAWAAAGGGR